MSKRGPRFTKEEKLAIVKEGEKTGGKQSVPILWEWLQRDDYRNRIFGAFGLR